MIHIGKSIRELRKSRQLAQHDLAELAGLTPSFLSLVENGKRHPSLTVLQRIASALNVPEEVLIWDAVELPDGLADKDR